MAAQKNLSHYKSIIEREVNRLNKEYGYTALPTDTLSRKVSSIEQAKSLARTLVQTKATYKRVNGFNIPTAYDTINNAVARTVHQQYTRRRANVEASGIYDRSTPQGEYRYQRAKTVGESMFYERKENAKQSRSREEFTDEFFRQQRNYNIETDKAFYENMISSFETSGFDALAKAFKEATEGLDYFDIFITIQKAGGEVLSPYDFYLLVKSAQYSGETDEDFYNRIYDITYKSVVAPFLNR